MRYERGTPDGNGCIIDTDVNGQGQEASIAPGEQVTITFNVTVWRISTSHPITQVVAGISDKPVYGCLYNAVPPVYPGVTIKKTVNFVSADPGVFEICVSRGLQYTCQDALDRYPAARAVAATIEVSSTPQPPETASINGHVKDTETLSPISAALVECNSLTTRTDELGHYEFTGLSPKTYTVSASAAGYLKQTKTVDAVTPGTYTADFELTKEPVTPEAGENILALAIGVASTVALAFVMALKLKK